LCDTTQMFYYFHVILLQVQVYQQFLKYLYRTLLVILILIALTNVNNHHQICLLQLLMVRDQG
jgi:hypothetical protein